MNMKVKQSTPYAPLLIESMRSLGYSFDTAIADLIDNSVSAKAKNIDILLDFNNQITSLHFISLFEIQFDNLT